MREQRYQELREFPRSPDVVTRLDVLGHPESRLPGLPCATTPATPAGRADAEAVS